MCKIQDERHKADENKVGASNNAQKECSLSEFGTAQDHLEEHLRTNREESNESTKSEGCCRGVQLPSPCRVSGSGLLSVYHMRQHRQQARGDHSSLKI